MQLWFEEFILLVNVWFLYFSVVSCVSGWTYYYDFSFSVSFTSPYYEMYGSFYQDGIIQYNKTNTEMKTSWCPQPGWQID